MTDYDQPIGSRCCTPPTPGLRVLTFPDGVQSGVFGLDEIFAAVYTEGRQVDPDTAGEIVERLAVRNYIAPSVRHRYCALLVDEYEKYIQGRATSDRKRGPSAPVESIGRKVGLLSRLFNRRRRGSR